ncbi:hypothetical protein [Brachyspira innocens]|uniref:hypothetical protein n=1 Tax=Brachyspira innocens TaxID=13264 RepID=UPI0026F1E7BF|nr:hypothetical protein [Brachyspira innocens]
MTRVKKRQSVLYAYHYDELYSTKIDKVLELQGAYYGEIDGQETLFIKTGEYDKNNIKAVNVPTGYWLLCEGITDNRGELVVIDKVKAVSNKKFLEQYELLDEEPTLFDALDNAVDEILNENDAVDSITIVDEDGNMREVKRRKA